MEMIQEFQQSWRRTKGLDGLAVYLVTEQFKRLGMPTRGLDFRAACVDVQARFLNGSHVDIELHFNRTFGIRAVTHYYGEMQAMIIRVERLLADMRS